MTKDELLLENAQLRAKVEDTSHLAEAVEAKDAEISRIKKEHKDILEKIEKERTAALAEAIAKTKENKEKEMLNRPVAPDPKDQETIKALQNQVRSLGIFINRYKDVFKSFLKATQGSLENVIELESILFNSILPPQPGNSQK